MLCTLAIDKSNGSCTADGRDILLSVLQVRHKFAYKPIFNKFANDVSATNRSKIRKLFAFFWITNKLECQQQTYWMMLPDCHRHKFQKTSTSGATQLVLDRVRIAFSVVQISPTCDSCSSPRYLLCQHCPGHQVESQPWHPRMI
jgi:hypothetical protein